MNNKWIVLPPDADGYHDVIDGEGMCIAACLPSDLANKISAGPDMYDALVAILYHDERGQGIGFSEAMQMAVEAIAKYRGE